jgi:hypothetical protein
LRGGRVTAFENNAIASELIHVGRSNIGITSLQTDVRPSVIVAVNQQDIRGDCGRGCLKRHAGNCARGKAKQKMGSLHLSGWLSSLENTGLQLGLRPVSGITRGRKARR